MTQFHMPVVRASFYDDNTVEAINAFLDLAAKADDGITIKAVRVEFYTHHEDIENIMQSASVWLFGENKDGDTIGVSPSTLTGALKLSYANVAAALSMDDIAIQSFAYCNIMPLTDQSVSNAVKGRLFTHVQARHFSLLGVEYPAGMIENDDVSHLAGPSAPMSQRRLFMTLVLPPVDSAHSELGQHTVIADAEVLIGGIYEERLDGLASKLPLAPLDLSRIEDLD